jgi:hypothetical protein
MAAREEASPLPSSCSTPPPFNTFRPSPLPLFQARTAERSAIQAELAMAAREEALRKQAERLSGWTDGDKAERDEAIAVAAREQVRLPMAPLHPGGICFVYKGGGGKGALKPAERWRLGGKG